MTNSKDKKLTDPARAFLEPSNPTHRQYEALRAYFVEKIPSAQAATRFGYTPGSFRVLCHQFRKNPHRSFFVPATHPSQPAPKKDRRREQIVALRKQNLSVYDIARTLTADGHPISAAMVSLLLRQEGFARLPRRRDEERPPATRTSVAAVADVRSFDLGPRRFRTRFGGLYLFLAWLARIPLDRMLAESGFPGSKMIPAEAAVRSLLALKLFGNARHSHIMSHVLDEGLGVFAGLNVIPKRSFLTEYSCRVDPACHPALMRRWFDAVGKLGLERGTTFDLDFHTIPFHGEDALVEKHYVSKRSRRQKGVLAFLAQDADKRVFCYANARLRKQDRNDEVLRFVRFWRERTGRLPEELVFDSNLTTYGNLDRLNRWSRETSIPFITLRRRSTKKLAALHAVPPSRWRRIELKNVARAYHTPRILDERISIEGYRGPIRQLTIADLGHEQPTLLLTNQLKTSPVDLIGRYAQRMLIENNIEDAIDFFHMDALSSAVAMKVDCDLQLTLMASSLYRLLAARIANGYERAKSRHLYRDFIDATALVELASTEICVRFQKRAHNPLLLAAGFADTDVRIPWIGNKRLHLVFG
jgi:hypothetical protein